MLLAGLAIIAVATLLWGWLLLRRYPRRFGLPGAPLALSFWAFTLGVVALVLAMFLELLGLPLLGGAETALLSGDKLAFVAFMVAAVLVLSPVEEFCKYVTFRISLVNRRQFWGLHRGALLGAAVGLGFASLENLGYIATSSLLEPGMEAYTAASRSAIGFPVHAMLGMLMGGLLGKWREGGGVNAGLAARALALPAGVHAAYNLVALGPTIAAPPSTDSTYGIGGVFFSASADPLAELAYLLLLSAFIVAFFLVLDRRLRAEPLAPAQGSVPPVQTSR